ncbi:MAG: hypothetical protein IKE75_00280 [Bacilli bacterium]|nr:hypothetical protein [Bacilli bacterium]
MILSKEELIKVTGGSITPGLINAITRGINVFLELGKVIGTAIRRAVTGKTCSP